MQDEKTVAAARTAGVARIPKIGSRRTFFVRAQPVQTGAGRCPNVLGPDGGERSATGSTGLGSRF